MSEKIPEWTIAQAALIFGVNTESLRRKCIQNGHEVKQGWTLAPKEFVEIIFGNKEFEQTRKIKADADLAELELQKKRGEVIAADVALKILIKCQAPIKAGLQQMPRLCYEVNPSDPEHARTILERHKIQIFESIEKSLEQLKELDSTDKPNDS